MIKLQITKFDINDNYQNEIEEYQNRNRYANDVERPEREIVKNILEVSVTEEQFTAIRKAVLENF